MSVKKTPCNNSATTECPSTRISLEMKAVSLPTEVENYPRRTCSPKKSLPAAGSSMRFIQESLTSHTSGSPPSYNNSPSPQNHLAFDAQSYTQDQQSQRNQPGKFEFTNVDSGVTQVSSQNSDEYRLQLIDELSESSEEKELTASGEALPKSERAQNYSRNRMIFPENARQAYHSMPSMEKDLNSPNRFIAFKYSSTTSRKKQQRIENSKTNKTIGLVGKGSYLVDNNNDANTKFGTRRILTNKRRPPIHQGMQATVDESPRKLEFKPQFKTNSIKPERIRKWLHDVLIKCELFQDAFSASEYAVDAMIKEMYTQDVKENEILVRQGDVGDAFFLVEYGKLDVLVRQEKGAGGECETIKVAEIKAGETVGEAALMYNTKRTATLQATKLTRVWIMDADQFHKIRILIRDFKKKRFAEQQKFLKTIPLFSRFKQRELMDLTQACHEVKFHPGETIISKEDNTDNDMYIIREGTAWVVRDRKKSISICQDEEVREGDYFMRMMRKNEDLASVKASSKVYCLKIRKDDFDFLASPYLVASDSLSSDSSDREDDEELPADWKNRVSYGLDDFEPLAVAGVGSFGHVVLVKVHKGEKKEVFALKLVEKNKAINMGQCGHMKNERRVMFMMDNPFIVKLYATYQDEMCVYFLQERVLGGEIFTLLRRETTFNESTARFYFGCVVLALEYMHSLDIIYRDLKPENLLITAKGYLKVTDFGFAKKRNQSTSLCGTREYLAPELITEGIQNFGVDWWCSGIFLYEMLIGQVPFRDSENRKLYEDILVSTPKFPNWVTIQSQELIHRLLEKNSFRRLGSGPRGAADIKQQNWFKLQFKEDVEEFDWDKLEACTLKAPYEPELTSDEDCHHFDEFLEPKQETTKLTSSFDPSLYEWCKEF